MIRALIALAIALLASAGCHAATRRAPAVVPRPWMSPGCMREDGCRNPGNGVVVDLVWRV